MALAFSWTGFADTDLEFSEFFDSDHTLSLRFMPQYPNGYEGPLLAENGSGTFVLGQGYWSKAKKSPYLYFAVGSTVMTTIAPLKTGIWYHLAVLAQVTASKRTFNLFFNSIPLSDGLEISATATGMPNGTLRLGKRTTGKTVNDRNAQFYGLLADVAVFDRTLGESALLALATPGKQLTGKETGLLAGYTFGEGKQPAKLARPVTLHGAVTTVPVSADWNNKSDAKPLPLPTSQQRMDLPFPLGEAWRTGQAWNATGTHNGLAAFCWDMVLDSASGGEYPDGTDGAPLYAAAPGTVAAVREIAPSGEDEYANVVDVKQANSEYASYVHVRQNSVDVAKGDAITQGEKLALTGDTGTGVGNFHLHFAVNDKPDQTKGFVTFPVAFSDYELKDTNGTWKPVARGVPKSGDVVRNPSTPKFGPRALTIESAVSRASNSLDLIATDTNGRAWVAHWTPNRYVRNWDRWRFVLSDIGGARPVAVASRSNSRLDIVTTDSAGRVQTGGWHETINNGVWGGWWRIRDLFAPTDAPVSIVARDSKKLDVFVVRKDGRACTAAWDGDVEDGKWRGWWLVANGVTLPGTPITAVSRAPNKLDVFMVGSNGGVYTAAWEYGVAEGKWRGWWRIGDLVAKTRTPIGVVARDPNKLDVFVARKDGAIFTAAWDRKVADGKWRGWWAVAGGVTSPGNPVSVVSRHPNKLDVFVVGKNAGVYTAAWEYGVADGKWRGWWRVRDLVACAGSAVAAVARDASKLDIFAVRKDGQMSTAAWDHKVAAGKWQGWWRIG